MKFVKKRSPENNSEHSGAGRRRKKFLTSAAAAGLLLLVESCAATLPAPVQKHSCSSYAECEIDAAEKRMDKIEKRLEAAKKKISDAEIMIRGLGREMAKAAMESLVIAARKRACEKFREELRMVKSLARYEEHRCDRNLKLDLQLDVKRKVHCPHIEYLLGVVKDLCDDSAKD